MSVASTRVVYATAADREQGPVMASEGIEFGLRGCDFLREEFPEERVVGGLEVLGGAVEGFGQKGAGEVVGGGADVGCVVVLGGLEVDGEDGGEGCEGEDEGCGFHFWRWGW